MARFFIHKRGSNRGIVFHYLTDAPWWLRFLCFFCDTLHFDIEQPASHWVDRHFYKYLFGVNYWFKTERLLLPPPMYQCRSELLNIKNKRPSGQKTAPNKGRRKRRKKNV